VVSGEGEQVFQGEPVARGEPVTVVSIERLVLRVKKGA